jgi:hypothetical protein
MKTFLKARHWQLFLLYSSPYIAQLVIPRDAEGSTSDGSFFIIFLSFGLTIIAFLGWMWAVAIDLYPLSTNRESIAFRIAFFWVVAYIIILAAVILTDRTHFTYLIIPHFIALVSIFYCTAYTARRIRDSKNGNDSIGIFFLILFFPVGIWILQPGINNDYGSASPDAYPDK